MKVSTKLCCALAGVCCLVIPASAAALRTTVTYRASFVTSALFAAGTITFSLASDAGQSCRYTYAWIDPPAGATPARGVVLEAKTSGFSTCQANAVTSFPTVVQIEPGVPSQGFDNLYHRRPVAVLALGETPSGELHGSLLLTGAVPIVYSIDLVPKP
jgi:hypothetical protein